MNLSPEYTREQVDLLSPSGPRKVWILEQHEIWPVMRRDFQTENNLDSLARKRAEAIARNRHKKFPQHGVYRVADAERSTVDGHGITSQSAVSASALVPPSDISVELSPTGNEIESDRGNVDSGRVLIGSEYQASSALCKPSGPFPFASDEELEAIEAEEAGAYPYA